MHMAHTALLAFLCLAAAIAPAAAADNDALDRIVKTGIVRVAVPDNFPPFGDLGSDGKLHGYDIDTAVLIAGALGVKPDLVVVSSTDRIAALTEGKVDLVISTLGKDPEREKLIDFSIAYEPFFSGVFGPADLPVSKPEDLAGKSIAVTQDTIEDRALTKGAPAAAMIKRYDDNARTGLAYLAHEAELIATGNVVASDVLARSPMKKTRLKFLLQNSPSYIGVNKNQPDLLARLNAILTTARQDGSLDKVSEQWLKAPLGDPEHPDKTAVK